MARADDPTVANTGAGPIAYADRGAKESVKYPLALIDVTMDLSARSVRVDASRSQPGWTPIASYEFSFGDGTVITQASPIASHTYTYDADFPVSVKAIGTDGRSASKADIVTIRRSAGTVGLLSQYNLTYVASSSTSGSLFVPHQYGLTAAGQFDLVSTDSGQVALVSRALGKYLTVNIDSSGVPSLSAWQTRLGDAELFTVVRNADGSISLKALVNNRYVSIQSPDSPFLVADRVKIGPWEKFFQVAVSDATRSLKAGVNSRFVAAESAGTKPLIANRTAVGPWEQFAVIDLGNGQVALFSRVNNRFVVAESAGTKPLIANRTAVGPWERFTLVRNSDGTVSLKAAINGRYVVAESAGTKPLIANRTAIGAWEKFTLG
ncbi:PKD domain-containing protein [Phytohabitans rumicis]|uniref:PKD domain-containing protein n=1 Tax=Phytohabitans rumicis TaxID=1076125 RepID=UPI001FEA3A9E|nr:PKD domain-containing protein [Phytohabitans rumicis]